MILVMESELTESESNLSFSHFYNTKWKKEKYNKGKACQ